MSGLGLHTMLAAAEVQLSGDYADIFTVLLSVRAMQTFSIHQRCSFQADRLRQHMCLRVHLKVPRFFSYSFVSQKQFENL